MQAQPIQPIFCLCIIQENEAKREEVAMLEARLESILQDNKTIKEENESLQTANKLQREDMDRIIQDEVRVCSLNYFLNNLWWFKI